MKHGTIRKQMVRLAATISAALMLAVLAPIGTEIASAGRPAPTTIDHVTIYWGNSIGCDPHPGVWLDHPTNGYGVEVVRSANGESVTVGSQRVVPGEDLERYLFDDHLDFDATAVTWDAYLIRGTGRHDTMVVDHKSITAEVEITCAS